MHRRHPYHPYESANLPGDEEENIVFRDAEPDAPDQARAAEEMAEPFPEAEAQEPLFAGQDSLRELEERHRAEMAELHLRSAAEMDNFKKRLAREHEEKMRFAAEKVLGDLLPTLDNFDLALQYGNKDDACKDMLQGLAVTRKLMLEAVARHGLKPVGEEGQEFDPAVHEAVGFEAHPDYAPQSVARVLQSGYRLNDRLLRPAKVMVTP